MFELIIKGLIVGVLISVPVGPIAVLCIQRTLNRGKYHGFATGAGAAFSDLIYAALTAFSLSFIIDIINDNQFTIEIVGAFIIFMFGFFLFRNNPIKQISDKSIKKESYAQDFATAFLLTIANPLIIFLFIAMFSRFNIIDSDATLLETSLGLICVFVGAIAWWFGLTTLVNLFRSRFNLRGLWFINKISGSFIMLLAFSGLIYSVLKHFELLG